MFNMKWRDRQRKQQEEQRAKQAANKGKLVKRETKKPPAKKSDDEELRIAVNKVFADMSSDLQKYMAIASTDAGNVLTSRDLQNALNQLQGSSAANQLAQYQQAQYAQQQYNKQSAPGRGQQMAGGYVTFDPSNYFFDPRNPGRPRSPDEPPKFAEGERVTINGNKTIYRVKHSEWDGYQYWYACVSDKGATKKVREEELEAPTAQQLKKPVDFDSVILADEKKQAIIDTLEGVANYDLIFSEWGFEDVMEKGKATSFLFWGPPGTGKTLMAQAMADKLGQDLLIIGSAEIESSEPGGAERAIKAFFQTKGKVLLFDECDSLVYERAAVGAILGAQVNALLTCLENYEGTVIFTTNRLGVLDEAFNRRLSLKVEFAMPDQATRVKIWQRMFPKKAPLDDNIDWERLASVEIAGGYIKNAVLRSARMAANRKSKVITEDLIVEALKDELKSMIEFEDAKANSSHVPRQSGVGYQRTSTINKVMGMGGSN